MGSQETEVRLKSEDKENYLESEDMLHTGKNSVAGSRSEESWEEVDKFRISDLGSLFPILAKPPFEVM